jgi:hypothetical protein
LFCQVCDTTQHLSDIWRINFPDKFVTSYLAPRQADRPSARYWVKEEIERLIDSLGGWLGKKLDSGALANSIALHNENKTILKELYEIKRNFPGAITNKQFFAMMKVSQQVDKADSTRPEGDQDGLKMKKGKNYTDWSWWESPVTRRRSSISSMTFASISSETPWSPAPVTSRGPRP